MVLCRDELEILEVGRRLPLGVLVLVEAEACAGLQDREVVQGDDGGRHGDHDGVGLAIVTHVVDGGEARTGKWIL